MIDHMDEVRALIEQARREGKWLWCSYQDLWFSPDELAAQNAEGKFRWGAINWRLRDPQERINGATDRAAAAMTELRRVEEQVRNALRSR